MILSFNVGVVPQDTALLESMIVFGWPGVGSPPAPIAIATATDLNQLDKGISFHSMFIDLGPTLGIVQEYIQPQITVGTNTILGPTNCVVLCKAVTAITISLPDVAAWVKEPSYRPYNSFQRCLWIKDMSGNANVDNITVTPFGSQTIDGLAQSFVISLNHGIMRLYPRNDLTGWYLG